MNVHGVVIWPPPQPLMFELKQTSCAEIGRFMSPSVAMHMRSEAASAPPNAQQQPQLLWSRISLMSVAQLGQFSAASNVSGMSLEGFRGT